MSTFNRLFLTASFAAAAMFAGGCKGENKAQTDEQVVWAPEQDNARIDDNPRVGELELEPASDVDYAAQGPAQQRPSQVNVVLSDQVRQRCEMQQAGQTQSATFDVQSKKLQQPEPLKNLSTCLTDQLIGEKITFQYFSTEKPQWVEDLTTELKAQGIPEDRFEFKQAERNAITPTSANRIEVQLQKK